MPQNAGYETIFTTWRSSSPAPSTCDELSEATRRTSASSSLQNVSGAGRPPKLTYLVEADRLTTTATGTGSPCR